MKILMVNKLYFPWVGGVEKTTQDIAEGLNKKENYQVRVLVCQPRGKRKVEEINGVEVYRAGSLGMFLGMPISFSFFLWFKKLSKGVDILHIHHPFPLASIAYLIFRPKAKLIIHYHSDIFRQKLSYFIFKPFLKKFLDEADVIITTSPRIIENSEILRPYKEKCQVIPSGIDLEKFKLTDEIKEKAKEIREQFGSPLILFVGRLIYYKGIEFLIEAFKEVKAQLVIVGSGPLEKDLKKLAETLGIKNLIHFLSQISGNELFCLLSLRQKLLDWFSLKQWLAGNQ
jgi:rhamnosyl/mannosyltransferase